MKRKIVLLLLICCFCLVGCKKSTKDNIVENLSKKISELNAYNLKGNLEIVNGEDMYIYDVEVSFQKNDLFKVYLRNTNNNHVQILLKNPDGVFVQTHKSTKQKISNIFFILLSIACCKNKEKYDKII